MDIIVVPYPGQSHVTAMLRLSETLLQSTSWVRTVTFVNTPYYHSRMIRAAQNTARLRMLELELPDEVPHEFYNKSQSFSKVFLCANGVSFVAQIHKLLQGMGLRLGVLITHHFLSWGAGVAAEHGLAHALFWSSAATVAAMFLNYPLLHRRGLCLFAPRQEEEEEGGDGDFPALPGLPAELPVDQYPGFFRTKDSTGRLAGFCEMQHGLLAQARFVLLNSCTALEADALQALGARAYALSPLSLPYQVSQEEEEQEEECMRWLDRQAEGSVAYVSFGSLVELRAEQLQALNDGLEASGCAFLWAVRGGGGRGRASSSSSSGGGRGGGLVVDWAPQRRVLGHKGVGGFVSHCGWNSVMESVASGVALLACPLMADQRTNAWMVEHRWRVGLRLPWDDARDETVVEAAAVAAGVRELISGDAGKSARATCERLRHTIAAAQSVSSSVEDFLRHITASASPAAATQEGCPGPCDDA